MKSPHAGPAVYASGTILDSKYRVTRVLASSPRSTTYLVEILSAGLGSKLALKVIHGSEVVSDSGRRELLLAIRRSQQVINKYVLPIRDVGQTAEGELFYTMDYSRGAPLHRILGAEGLLNPERSLAIVCRILRGLMAAHSAGVVHGALSPEHILVEARANGESIRLLNCGLHRRTPRGEEVSYLAPEVLHGQTPSIASDVYATGSLLFRCLTGRTPRESENLRDASEERFGGSTPAPSVFSPWLEEFPGIDEAILRAIDDSPQRRHTSARGFLVALTRSLESRAKISATPHGLHTRPRAEAPASSPRPPRSGMLRSRRHTVARRRHSLRFRRNKKSGLLLVLPWFFFSLMIFVAAWSKLGDLRSLLSDLIEDHDDSSFIARPHRDSERKTTNGSPQEPRVPRPPVRITPVGEDIRAELKLARKLFNEAHEVYRQAVVNGKREADSLDKILSRLERASTSLAALPQDQSVTALRHDVRQLRIDASRDLGAMYREQAEVEISFDP